MSLSQSIYSLLPGSMRTRISPVIKRALRSLTVTTVYPGVLMDLDPNEWIQNQLRRNKISEPHTVARIQSILKPGDTYVDVGCHVGYLTLVARRAIGPSGLVLAIDPQPYNCAKVLHNWVLNSYENIIVYPAAVSDGEYQLMLNDQPLNDRARLSVTAASLAGDMPQRFAVPARALVNIMKERSLDGIALLKIDAEGHELEIVRGIGERLRSVQNMIVEVHDASLPKCNEMLRFLAAADFEFFTVHGKRWLGPQDEIPEINLWVRSRCALTPVQE